MNSTNTLLSILILANLGLALYTQRDRWSPPPSSLKPALHAEDMRLLEPQALNQYPARTAATASRAEGTPSMPAPTDGPVTPMTAAANASSSASPGASSIASLPSPPSSVAEANTAPAPSVLPPALNKAPQPPETVAKETPAKQMPAKQMPSKEASAKQVSAKETVAQATSQKASTAKDDSRAKDTPATKTAATPTTEKAATNAGSACYEWSGFTFPRATEAVSLAQQLNIQSQTNLVSTPQIGMRYWVYKPPLASAEAALAKADELRKLGIEDFFVVQDDPKWRHAISFGIFRDEKLADKLMADLKAKGVRALVKAPRPGGQAIIKLQAVSPQQYSEIRLSLSRFPDTVLKEIACQ